MYESLRDGSATVDLEGKIVEFNPEFQEMLGYPPEEIYRLTYQDITPEPWQALEARIIEQQVFTRGYSDLYEKELRRQDGSIIPVELRTYLIRNNRGIPIGMWAIVRDLTERKRASEALRLAQFSIDQASEPILWIGPRSEIIYANKAACQGLGYLRQELMLMSICDIDASFPSQDWPDRWEELKAQSSLSLESQHRRKDGTVFPVALSLNHFRYKDGSYVFAFFRDISESKQWERRQEQLSRMREQLLQNGGVAEKLKLITDGVVQIFEADFCRIWMIRPGDQCETGCYHAGVTDGAHVCRHRDLCLHLMASSGRYTHIDSPRHGRVPFGCYKIGLVAAGEESKFLTNNAQHDPRIHDHQWAQQLGLVAFAGYQLVDEDHTTVGVLALFSTRAITPQEFAVLEGVASTTSQVIQMAVAEETLRKSEARYRLVFEEAPLGIMHYDQTSTIIQSNEKFERMIGAPEEQFIGFNMIRQLRDAKMREAVEASLRGQVGYYEDDFLSVTAGKLTPTRAIFQPIFSSDGLVSGGVAIFEDITERKRVDDALRESEAKYRTLIMNIPARVFKGYADWRVEFLDDAVYELTGHPTEEFNTGQRKWLGLIVPEDLEKVREIFIQALRTDKSYLREYRIRNCAGEIRWIRERGRIICHQDGRINYVTGVFSDITEHKQLELELEQLRQRQELILKTAGEGILGLDKAGTVTFVNPAAMEMCGYKAEEVVGQLMHDLIHHTKVDGTSHPPGGLPHPSRPPGWPDAGSGR